MHKIIHTAAATLLLSAAVAGHAYADSATRSDTLPPVASAAAPHQLSNATPDLTTVRELPPIAAASAPRTLAAASSVSQPTLGK